MTFSEWFRALLDKHGMKPGDAAASLGISDSAVSKWLKGRYRPLPPQCQRIAERFQLSEEEVLEAAGHLSRAPEPSKESGAQRQLDAWVRSLSQEEQEAALELRPLFKAMVEKFLARDPHEERRIAEPQVRYHVPTIIRNTRR